MDIKLVTNQFELHTAFQIRKAVFVEEQGVSPEIELDEHDASANHILVYNRDEPVGTGRWRDVEGIAKLERICILPTYRKLGYGKAIVEALEESARSKGFTQTKLHGQVQAQTFYERLGYQTVSEVFHEEGIPHIAMVKQLKNAIE